MSDTKKSDYEYISQIVKAKFLSCKKYDISSQLKKKYIQIFVLIVHANKNELMLESFSILEKSATSQP